ncbi:MAG: glycosyltransferase [Anaerolineae bacterium]|nr:glycosyltransferase [Anaerolineae bacterium]
MHDDAALHPTVSVIIPALNEAENLPHVLSRIPKWVDEVILIPGPSTDGTAEVAMQLMPDIRIVEQEGKGKGAALRCGMRAATGDILVLLDADGSTDPHEIPAFVGALLTGADYAKGSRFLQGGGTVDMTWLRQLGNGALMVLTNILFKTRYSDITYGYNAVWREHAECMALNIDNWAMEVISNIRVARQGLRVVEVASFEHLRIGGEAKLATFSAGWMILTAIVREWFEIPKRRAIQNAATVSANNSVHTSPAAEQARSLSNRRSDVTTSDLSIVICAYTEQRWDDLNAAIASMLHQTQTPREIIVVIDHNAKLLERARAAFEGIALVTLIENAGEQGLSGARNSGIAASTGKVIAFIDEDAEAAPDWLDKMAGCYTDASVMGVGGSITPLWLTGKPAWFPDEFNWVVGCTYRGLPTRPAPIRNLIGCNMSLRREVFDEAGNFRIGRVGTLSVGLENDDTEMCIRAQKHFPDRIFLYDPSVRAVNHRVPASRKAFKYFAKRCLSEGISKARLSSMVGSQKGLSSERSYVIQTLPQGVLRGLAEALRGDLSGVGRALGIVAGLSITVVGFCMGKIMPKPKKTMPARSPLTVPNSQMTQIN